MVQVCLRGARRRMRVLSCVRIVPFGCPNRKPKHGKPPAQRTMSGSGSGLNANPDLYDVSEERRAAADLTREADPGARDPLDVVVEVPEVAERVRVLPHDVEHGAGAAHEDEPHNDTDDVASKPTTSFNINTFLLQSWEAPQI